MLIARDVIEQRRAERQLLASRRRLAEAQRIAQVGNWGWDLETDELDLERVLDRMRLMCTDPAPFAFEHRVVRDDGAVRTVLARGEGVLDEDGRLVRFIGTEWRWGA